MSNQRLLITEEVNTPRFVDSSMPTKYTYKNGEVNVIFNGKIIAKTKAKLGDTFIIQTNGYMAKIETLFKPRKASDLIMWLAGFNKDKRANTQVQYDKVVKKHRLEYMWDGYIETQTQTYNCTFASCNNPKGGVYKLAIFIPNGLSTNQLFELLKQIKTTSVYPSNYTKIVLKQCLKLDNDELEAVKSFTH